MNINHGVQNARKASTPLLLALSILISLLCTNSQARTLMCVTFPIPLMVESLEKGVFIEITQEIAKRLQLTVNCEMMPPKRAIHQFLTGQIDLLMPALNNFFPGHIPARTQETITMKRDYIFSLKSDKVYHQLSDLRGKRVGITLGYPYTKDLLADTTLKIDIAHSDEANAGKLLRKRIDAFLIEERTGIAIFQKLNARHLIQYDPASPTAEEEVYFAFQPTPEGREFAKQFNATLKAMKQDGHYQNIVNAADKYLNKEIRP